MAHWCLKKLDYDRLDPFAKPVPRVSWPARSRTSSVSSGASTISSRSNTSRGSKGKGHIKFVLPKPEDGATPASPAELEQTANEKFKTAMVFSDNHRLIPDILAEWPCSTLRLAQILSPEACQRVFTSLDQLWSLFLHGFLIRKPTCRLKCLDLTDFIPTNTMIYTVLQLFPLLSYRGDLHKQDIWDRIVKMHGLKDPDILHNLSQFLDKVLSHPVFARGRKVRLPGPLEIIIDYLPISADKLSLYCWMMASSLYDVTNVFIRIRTAVLTYAEAGPEFRAIDPMLPLEIFVTSACVQDLEGLAVDSIPPKYTDKVVLDMLPRLMKRSFQLHKLAFTNTGADLSHLMTCRGLTSIISMCSGLTRLDLSKSRVCGILGQALESASLPLEFLNLTQCCLDIGDVTAIFDSKHSAHLRDINLSHVYSNACVDCMASDHTEPPIRDVNHNTCRWPLSEETDGIITSPRGGPSLDFWKSQTSISSPRIDTNDKHLDDRALLHTIFANIHKLANLTILDLMSHTFGDFRIDRESLELLVESLPRLEHLKQLNVERIPLWDEDIFVLIEAVSKIGALQSVSLTRSSEAPTMQKTDRFLFSRRMYEARGGKLLRTFIENFGEDSQETEDPDSNSAGSDLV